MPSGFSPTSKISGSSSSSLLERAKAHDPDAWSRLSQVYSPLVYHWCRRAGLQASDSADVVQEVFRAVVRAIDRFRKDRPSDTFRGWLWTITRNKIRDHFRGLAGQPEAEGGSTANVKIHQLPAAAPEEADKSSRLKRTASLAYRAVALMQTDFEERTWQAFWRASVEEQPPAEIAEELGMSVAAVYMAKSRVLRRLRQELDGLDLFE